MLDDWINLGALWRIVVVAIIAGAGLPAVFAIGLRLLDSGDDRPAGDTSEGTVVATRNPIALAAAGVCFAAVLAGIAWGIYLIVAGT